MLFTERILVEAMGVKVTVPFLSEIDLNGLLAATAAVRLALESGDRSAVDAARRSLHVRYVAKAGQRLRSTIAAHFDLCERYPLLYGNFRKRSGKSMPRSRAPASPATQTMHIGALRGSKCSSRARCSSA